MGRPSKYTSQIATKICSELATGKSLVKICQQDWAPHYATVMRWLVASPEFCENYAHARELQAEYYAQQIIDLADAPLIGEKVKTGKDGVEITTGDCVERSKLMVDARKWIASKLLPKKYGDKVALTGGSDDDKPVRLVIERQGYGNVTEK